MTALELDARALRQALLADGDEVTITLKRQTAQLLADYLDTQIAGAGSADDAERKHEAVAELFAMQNGWD